jgi:hypothetical protein
MAMPAAIAAALAARRRFFVIRFPSMPFVFDELASGYPIARSLTPPEQSQYLVDRGARVGWNHSADSMAARTSSSSTAERVTLFTAVSKKTG